MKKIDNKSTKNPSNASPKSPTKYIQVSAPGKIILYGEHSVVYGKTALAASLGLRTKMRIIQIEGDDIIVKFAKYSKEENFNMKMLKEQIFDKFEEIDYQLPDFSGHMSLLGIIMDFLSRPEQHLLAFMYLYIVFFNNWREMRAISVTIDSDLTLSSGTGSSASFSTTIAGGFLALRENKTRFTRNDLDIISKWSFNVEKIIHGTPSGIDNTICTFGGFLEFQKGNKSTLLPPIKIRVILINTNVPRNTRQQVDKTYEMKRRFTGVIDGVLDAMHETSLDAVRCFKQIHNGENIQQNYDSLIDLVEINQNLLRCLNVSHPKLEQVINILDGYDLKGKLTGAGGGGYAFCFIPLMYQRTDEVMDALKHQHFECILTELGGDGVRIDV